MPEGPQGLVSNVVYQAHAFAKESLVPIAPAQQQLEEGPINKPSRVHLRRNLKTLRGTQSRESHNVNFNIQYHYAKENSCICSGSSM